LSRLGGSKCALRWNVKVMAVNEFQISEPGTPAFGFVKSNSMSLLSMIEIRVAREELS
jgi:hypothetical protein